MNFSLGVRTGFDPKLCHGASQVTLGVNPSTLNAAKTEANQVELTGKSSDVNILCKLQSRE